MPCVSGQHRSYLFTFRVSRSEASLMASNTSYLGVYRVASALSCVNYALLVSCKRLSVHVLDLGYKGSALLCNCSVDLICYS
jgi:hypothetical protein